MTAPTAEAGVDIDAQESALATVKQLARQTYTPGVLSDIGSFGGLFRPELKGMEEPVLVSSADGVGTKLMVARMAGDYSTVGRDLVNHCVNDILVQGATPLFFLDYVGAGILEPEAAVGLVQGIADGCKENGCALLGGETAENAGLLSAWRLRVGGIHRRPGGSAEYPGWQPGSSRRQASSPTLFRPSYQWIFAGAQDPLRRSAAFDFGSPARGRCFSRGGGASLGVGRALGGPSVLLTGTPASPGPSGDAGIGSHHRRWACRQSSSKPPGRVPGKGGSSKLERPENLPDPAGGGAESPTRKCSESSTWGSEWFLS